ncbi:MAG TPA: CehA/McbA family metallohydrolase [Vicinamibacterales bacterium]|nr:CehA/McbA family metallohydrolase [Vicinamibacterales bacterium]
MRVTVRRSILRCLLPLGLAVLAMAASGMTVAVPQQPAGTQWFKGNTHTHTTESDGDSPPEDVARWYRDHGYNFLVLSDHNVLTGIEPPAATPAGDKTAAQPFILIKGEEVSDRFEKKPVHLNGLGITTKVDPQGGDSLTNVLQRNVDAIRRADGIPHINHPNFNWSFSTAELQQVRNNRLLEIFNGHPQVNNLGGGGVPALEQVWDAILSSGTLVYGIAVDDAHNFKQPGNPAVAGPGRGWVVVRADRLEPRSILQALEDGQFYASTGVELSEYTVTARSMVIGIKKDTWAKYRVQFIGTGGRVLHEAIDSPAEYLFRGDEGYVRAKVFESNGRVAWTQPVLVTRRPARP